MSSSLDSALIANFFLRLAGSAGGLMLTLYLAQINRELYPVSATQLGLIVAGSNLVEMALSPILGAQSDRRGRRVLLVLGPLLGVVMIQATALTTILMVLFFTRLLEGVSAASSTPALLSYLSAGTEANRVLRGRVMGLFEVGTALGLTLGTVAGSLLWEPLGRMAFTIAGLLYLTSAIFFWRVRDADSVLTKRPRSGTDGSEQGPYKGLLLSFRRVLAFKPLLRFAPAWLAVNTTVGLWLTHAIYQMTEGHEQPGQYLVGAFNGTGLAAVLGGYTFFFGTGVLIWGNYIGRIGELRAMRLTLLGMLGAAAMIWMMNHSGGPGPLLWLALAIFACMVLLESGFAPAAVTYLARLSSDVAEDRGLMMGLYSVVLGLGQLLGGWVGGPFADRWGVDGVLVLTFILGVVALALTWTLAPVEKGPSA